MFLLRHTYLIRIVNLLTLNSANSTFTHCSSLNEAYLSHIFPGRYVTTASLSSETLGHASALCLGAFEQRSHQQKCSHRSSK